MNQLIKQNNCLGDYDKVYPITGANAVMYTEGVSLQDISSIINHFQVPFKNNEAETKLQIFPELRKRGLWVTYVNNEGEHRTEYYKAEELDDKNWIKDSNWEHYLNQSLINKLIDEKLKWYKA